MGPTGGSEDEQTSGEHGKSRISRRKFVAWGLLVVALLLIGVSAGFVDSGTVAQFSDSRTASGTVVVDGDPTLNYRIVDESANSNAEYQIHYQAEWVTDFKNVTVRVNNTQKSNLNPVTYSRPTEQGRVSHPSVDNDGGAYNDTYAFNFTVYDTSGNAVIRKNTTDVAGDGGQGEGDFGNSNSPEIRSFTVIDNGDENQDYSKYAVEHTVARFTDSYVVNVTFKDMNTSSPWADDAVTNSQGNGTVYYASDNYKNRQGGTSGDTYRITVEVVNENGLVVDAANVTDVSADGSNTSYP